MTFLIKDDARQITESLIQRIGEERFDLWFGTPDAISVADRKLVVRAKDQFSLGRIRAQFDGELRQLIRSRAESIDDLIYSCADRSQRHAPAQAPMLPSAKHATQPASASRPKNAICQRGTGVESNGAKVTDHADVFDDFVFGKNNSLAETSVRRIIANPGEISPFFLHASVGAGKSSLLNRMVQSCRRNSRHRRGIYVTAEQFTSHFVEALKGRGLPLFRRKYRELDVLAVDDLQFFDNKRATLVELQSTVDQLQRGGKQVLLAADRPPNELGFLGAELANRLCGGLVCRLNYPCESGRFLILQRLCQRRALNISTRHLEFVAQQLCGDVRQLTGAVNRLHAAQLANMDLSERSAVLSLLTDLVQANHRPLSIESIEQAVCDVCGVGSTELRSAKRSKRINVARNLAMWLARKHTGNAFSEIGLHYGGRSHSTVISAQRKVSGWLESGESIPLANVAQCPAADAIHRIESKLRIG